jgi:uncharacterized protein DUF6883
MKIPNFQNAVVSERKLVRYLMSVSHPHGRHKAVFFGAFGFFAANWQDLAEALLKHAAEHEVTRVEESPFGIRYIVEGNLVAPNGRTPLIRAVWFIETGQQVARFVTAYPLEKP